MKMHFLTMSRSIAIGLGLAGLLACGGGGGSSASSQPASTPTTPTTPTNPVTVPTAKLDLLAGDWDSGAAYRDGTIGSARFGLDARLVRDSAGNTYVGDYCVIRKIDTSGQVTTLAGDPAWRGSRDGVGTQARIGSVTAIALDEKNNQIYFTDYDMAAVRRLSLVDKQVTTLVGGLSASSLFDVQHTMPSNAESFELGKTPWSEAPALIDCYCLAFDKLRNRLYAGVAQGPINQILMIDLIAKTIETYVGGASTWGGVKVDGESDAQGAYFSNYHTELPNHHRLNAAIDTPFGLVVDDVGIIYVGQAPDVVKGDKLIKVDPSTDLATSVIKKNAQPANTIKCMAWDALAKQIAFSDFDGSIYVFNPSDGSVVNTQIVGGSSCAICASLNVVYFISPDGTYSSFDLATQTKTILGGKAFVKGVQDGQGASARFSSVIPTRWLDADGRMLLVDGHAIRKVDTQGNVSTFVGSVSESGETDAVGTQARLESILNWPSLDQGLVRDAQGNLYAVTGDTVYTGACIRKIAVDGTVSTLAGTSHLAKTCVDGTGSAAGFMGITAMALGPDGNLYVADSSSVYGTTQIRRIDPKGTVTTLSGGLTGKDLTTNTNITTMDGDATTARFGDISMLWFDAKHNFYALDSMQAVRRIGLDGSVVTIAGDLLSSARKDSLVDGSSGSAIQFEHSISGRVSTDPSGNLLFVHGNGGIYRINTDGTLNVLVLPAPANSTSTSFDIDGSKGVAQVSNNDPRLSPDTTSNAIYVTCPWDSSIRRINADGSIVSILRKGDDAPGAFDKTGVYYPSDLVVLPSGDLVFSRAGVGLMKLTEPNLIK